jgi:predicted TIM-barrel fold metal-dependent hydrolase
MWANDYPHSETTWPHSHKILAEAFENVPRGEIQRIVHDNCVELYGLR